MKPIENDAPAVRVYLDIETIPGQQPGLREAIAAALPEVPALVMPICPRHYKNTETIQAWQVETRPKLLAEAQAKHQQALEKREAAIDELYSKTALSGEYGQVVCISWAVEDEAPRALLFDAPECEKELLQAFFMALSQQLNDCQPMWVGHNISFDLRFLYQRAVIHAVQPFVNLYLDVKPWSERLQDTMLMWAGIRGNISLERLCQALGLPGKGGYPDEAASDEPITCGSQVWTFIQQGRLEEVINYCKGDVERCRTAYKRLTFVGDSRLPAERNGDEQGGSS